MPNIRISEYNELWDHTMNRIITAERKAKDYQDFVRKMVTRLNRITHEEKIHYAIAVLKKRGHNDVVDIYEGRLLMDHFLKQSQGGF